MVSDDLLRLLTDLVAFDTTSRRSNLELIDYVQHYLRRYGVDSELIFDETRSKANLYATIGTTDSPGVMLSGHTDVVPVDGQDWHTDPFSLVSRDGCFYARGSADMKGFIACVLAQVPQMTRRSLRTSAHIALSYDEEVGCIGVRRLIELMAALPVRPMMGVIGEPTGMQVVRAHKGKQAFRVTVRGRSSHSAYPTEGVNAVDTASELVAYIRQLQQNIRVHGPFDDAYTVPNTTLHVGTIHGGTALNIVPEKCVLEFEIRHLPEQDVDRLVADIRGHIATVLEPPMQAVYPDTGIEIEVLTSYPGLSIQTDAAVVGLVQSLLDDTEGTQKISFGSEAGLFAGELGIPAVVCGPGSIQQAHRADEYVSEEQLDRCMRFISKLTDLLVDGIAFS